MKSIIALISMALTLAVAWLLDYWVISMRYTTGMSSDIFPLLWLTVFGQLVIASALIALAWYVVYRVPRSLAVIVLYVLVGLVITISPVVYYFAPEFGQYLFQSINTLFRQAGTFVFLIGLANFFLGARPRRKVLPAKEIPAERTSEP